MPTQGVYVYGVVRHTTAVPIGLSGVGTPPARLTSIGRGAVRAVVSEAPARLRARRRDLMAHQELLVRLSEVDSVLPMRFGMVATGEQTVLQQLATTEKACLEALEHLAGRVEINVKAFPAQDALASVLAQEPQVRRLRQDARRAPGYESSVRLGEAVAKALARRAAEAGEEILAELTPMSHAVSRGPEVHDCALNVSFLVDRARQEEFRMSARRLADARPDHVDLRIVGPLPCYSFVAGGPSLARAGASWG
ncbi:GvpL/GvpF family gas vesicle protein [Streptomyces sp. NBC_01218]|uniref:GvpL/GvpF family gas vesicle protein n=1 Tax=unclassified Streptomyces TaxID=2593676 RepID=UPI0023B90A98|nr:MULTISPECIES: GvpL/GvpF family gas vesicle protein [unclassified Streptomyces]WEH38171.1 GvpL/GvpF family gas vesicle protein [Streptomyces sp. AM 2-1-1]WSQ49831.1 GvpL/GvpF family gas vesicle protein [Streptomyces sp. NBC_01218]